MTHALLLRGGRIVAAGPIGEVLIDDLLSDTGCRCTWSGWATAGRRTLRCTRHRGA